MSDTTYQPKVYRKNGGDEFVVASGGTITVESGGTIAIESGGLITGLTVTASVVAPDASDGAALGSTALMWSDLFLANGGVINFNNGNVTITHSAGALACTGALTISIGTESTSTTTGSLIVTGGIGFSGDMYVGDDIFLTTGAVLNFNAGNVTITHSSGALAIAGADISMVNDKVLTLGTTVATAATKVTLEFDATTTGIGQFIMGSISVPMVLNADPGATVVGQSINILQSAGAGDCDDLLGSYTKVAFTGAGDSGTTAVGGAFRAYVGAAGGDATVVSQLYGIQPWVSHFGTGAVTAMSALSAKCDVNTGNFTASTVNAGHFHVEGASTVTAQFDGVMIEIYPDVTCLDSMLALAVDSGATVSAGIRASGAFTYLFDFAATGSGITHGGAAAAAVAGYLKVRVGSTAYRIPYLADSDS